MGTPLLAVEAPSIAPYRGGLLAVANVINATDPHFMAGVDYQPEACGVPLDAPGLCFPDTAQGVDQEAPKEFDDTPDYLTGAPFALYRGFECYLSEYASYAADAEKALDHGETVGVERAVQRAILNGDNTVVIAGTFDPQTAVARLEQIAGSEYGGAPTIHLDRFATSILLDKGVLKADDDFTIHTQQGSLVANGAGYGATGPEGVVAAAGQFWMYATGQVNIWRGPAVVNEAKAQETNRARAIAERTYVATAECFVAAILVTTGGTP